jgi:uncharacterized OsmC-like protein
VPAAIERTATEALRRYRATVEKDPSAAALSPRVVAHWVGGDASRVECDGAAISLGGEGNPTPMDAVLAALAACNVDVVATNATLLGLDVERLTVRAAGSFDLRAYLGFDDAPSPGFDAISYVVHATIPQATPEQVRRLHERCERSSPVGDSLARAIPLKLRFESGGA